MTDQTERLLTLAEAATLTGLTPDALRQRLKRGSIRRSVKGNDGRLRIRLADDEIAALKDGRPFSRSVGRQTEQPAEQNARDSAAIRALEAHVSTLKDELAAARTERGRLLDMAADERKRATQAEGERDDLRKKLDSERVEAAAKIDSLKTEKEQSMQGGWLKRLLTKISKS